MTSARKTLSIIILACSHAASPVGAATISLTSLDQIDFTNVVKAYDFTRTSNNGTTFDIGGVTFTRYNWNSDTTFDDLTLGNDLTIDNQSSGAADITLGGTATDRANFNAMMDKFNIGAQGGSPGSDMTITVTGLTNGTYTIQYFAGSNNDRHNTIYYRPEVGADIELGSFDDAGVYLIKADVEVTDGNLVLVSGDNVSAANGDNRRLINGLIISQVPEPTSALLGGLGTLLLLRRRR